MKKILGMGGAAAGLAYGTLAIAKVYATAPLPLQAVIVLGVSAVGACAGWLIGLALDAMAQK